DAQASADGLDGLIADLQDQVDALQEQVDELERQAAAGPASVGPSVAAGPTLGDRLGNPPALTTDGTLGAVIASTDARCLLGAAGDAALTAPRSMPELTGQSPSDVSEIISRVELLRHESVDPDPEVQVLTGNEFDSLVQAQLGPIPAADIADEKSMLELLGAVPPGYDLAGAYGDAPSGIAGFYDPSDGVVRVRRRDGSDGLGPIWEVVLAHEVDHAIDDSAFGLPGDLATDVDSELAATAIGEGDATIAMQLYASTYLGLPAELSALAEASARNPAAGYPPYLLAQAQFPYVEGARYLCYRYLQGGWNRVDREFLAVPATTYQVMFPERQQAAAVVPSEVGAVPPGWEGTGIESFGAANVMWLLQAPGADATKALPGARDAAGDWRGGAVSVFRHGGSSAVALRLSTASGALCAAMSNWYAAMRPGATRSDNGDAVEFTEADHVARVRCVAGEVHVAIGPSAAVVDPLAD
ncbi:MAG: hypothetical protein QOD72_3620, partial [Acidimicrobiaceae bacterium]|nr:hypothetical protein [Acidimicrobiaceae bacterium]